MSGFKCETFLCLRLPPLYAVERAGRVVPSNAIIINVVICSVLVCRYGGSVCALGAGRVGESGLVVRGEPRGVSTELFEIVQRNILRM